MKITITPKGFNIVHHHLPCGFARIEYDLKYKVDQVGNRYCCAGLAHKEGEKTYLSYVNCYKDCVEIWIPVNSRQRDWHLNFSGGNQVTIETFGDIDIKETIEIDEETKASLERVWAEVLEMNGAPNLTSI